MTDPFTRKLRRLCRSRNGEQLSRKQLAVATGVSPRQIRHIEEMAIGKLLRFLKRPEYKPLLELFT